MATLIIAERQWHMSVTDQAEWRLEERKIFLGSTGCCQVFPDRFPEATVYQSKVFLFNNQGQAFQIFYIS